MSRAEEPGKRGRLPAPAPRPTRRLSFPSRVRALVRREADRALAADPFWSAAFVVVVVALLAWPSWSTEEPEVGDVVREDLLAPRDVDVPDPERTEEERRRVREGVPNVYVYDSDHGARLARQLSLIFDQGRRALEEASRQQEDGQRMARRLLADHVPEPVLRTATQHRFDAAVEQELGAVLSGVMGAQVVGNKALLELEPGITLVHTSGDRSQNFEDYQEFIDVDEARGRVRKQVLERLERPAHVEQALAELAVSFVDANVHYDSEATGRKRGEATRAVPHTLVRVSRGEMLARKGQLLSADDVERIRAVLQESRKQLDGRGLIGLVVLASMLAFFLYRYTRYHQRDFRKLAHLHSLMVLMLLSMLSLVCGMMWLAGALTDGLTAPFNHLGSYPYLIPVGAGAILVALLANGRIATVYSAFASLLFGAATGWDPFLTLWAMLVHCAGVYAISTYRERAALLRAGLVVGGAGAAAALALEAVKGTLEPVGQSLYGAGLAFLGGAVGVGLLISFSLPMLERLFNVLTDIRLLELSNVNNPLLSELALKAPGSYNHSLVVGTLAEEAAKAIGANSLFCRVAAFYHDIGKMNKPEYYVENQRGVNPHDRLSPSMSALVIASHVKEGIKMAREAGLPEQIVEIIPQHHGTKLMTYFYEKAKSSADPSLGPVMQEDFRYPGPKPQTREAAIFMLADAVEAAARTVDEPSPNRLREMIRKVTNAIVVGGELDSCDLTFADLEKIQNAFLRCLVSQHHHRVDYPGFDFGRSRSEARVNGRSETKAAAELQDRKVARGS